MTSQNQEDTNTPSSFDRAAFKKRVASEIDFDTLFEAYSRIAKRGGGPTEREEKARATLNELLSQVPDECENDKDEYFRDAFYAKDIVLFTEGEKKKNAECVALLSDFYESVQGYFPTKYDFYRESFLVKWCESDIELEDADRKQIQVALESKSDLPKELFALVKRILESHTYYDDVDKNEVNRRVIRRFHACEDRKKGTDFAYVLDCVVREVLDVERLKMIAGLREENCPVSDRDERLLAKWCESEIELDNEDRGQIREALVSQCDSRGILDVLFPQVRAILKLANDEIKEESEVDRRLMKLFNERGKKGTQFAFVLDCLVKGRLSEDDFEMLKTIAKCDEEEEEETTATQPMEDDTSSEDDEDEDEDDEDDDFNKEKFEQEANSLDFKPWFDAYAKRVAKRAVSKASRDKHKEIVAFLAGVPDEWENSEDAYENSAYAAKANTYNFLSNDPVAYAECVARMFDFFKQVHVHDDTTYDFHREDVLLKMRNARLQLDSNDRNRIMFALENHSDDAEVVVAEFDEWMKYVFDDVFGQEEDVENADKEVLLRYADFVEDEALERVVRCVAEKKFTEEDKKFIEKLLLEKKKEEEEEEKKPKKKKQRRG